MDGQTGVKKYAQTLHHRDLYYWWRKASYHEKTTNLPQITNKHYLLKVVLKDALTLTEIKVTTL